MPFTVHVHLTGLCYSFNSYNHYLCLFNRVDSRDNNNAFYTYVTVCLFYRLCDVHVKRRFVVAVCA